MTSPASEAPRVVVGAALVRDGRVLAARRSRPPELAGRWELPGGAVEPGEDEAGALRRECDEELGVAVRVGRRLGVDVDLPGGRVLRVHWCSGAPGDATEPVAHEHQELRWVGSAELDELDWLDTDRLLLDELRAGLGVPGVRPPGRA